MPNPLLAAAAAVGKPILMRTTTTLALAATLALPSAVTAATLSFTGTVLGSGEPIAVTLDFDQTTPADPEIGQSFDPTGTVTLTTGLGQAAVTRTGDSGVVFGLQPFLDGDTLLTLGAGLDGDRESLLVDVFLDGSFTSLPADEDVPLLRTIINDSQTEPTFGNGNFGSADPFGGGSVTFFDIDGTASYSASGAIPEPAALALVGFAGLTLRRRRVA